MTSGKAIVIGSAVIGLAVIVAAFVWRAPPPEGPSATGGGPAAGAPDAPGRYQIVRVEDGVSWRLDTATGEMTACRIENDRMVCARSVEATEFPRMAADEIERRRAAGQEAERAREDRLREQDMAILDRILGFVKWVVERAMGAGNGDGPSPSSPDGSGGAPRTL